MHPLEQLRDDALGEIEAAPDEQALEAARIKYLGKKRQRICMGRADENAQQRRKAGRWKLAQ